MPGGILNCVHPEKKHGSPTRPLDLLLKVSPKSKESKSKMKKHSPKKPSYEVSRESRMSAFNPAFMDHEQTALDLVLVSKVRVSKRKQLQLLQY